MDGPLLAIFLVGGFIVAMLVWMLLRSEARERHQDLVRALQVGEKLFTRYCNRLSTLRGRRACNRLVEAGRLLSLRPSRRYMDEAEHELREAAAILHEAMDTASSILEGDERMFATDADLRQELAFQSV